MKYGEEAMLQISVKLVWIIKMAGIWQDFFKQLLLAGKYLNGTSNSGKRYSSLSVGICEFILVVVLFSCAIYQQGKLLTVLFVAFTCTQRAPTHHLFCYIIAYIMLCVLAKQARESPLHIMQHSNFYSNFVNTTVNTAF